MEVEMKASSESPATTSGAKPAKTRGQLEFLASDDALGLYLREIRKNKVLTRKEERALFDRIRAGEKRALHELISSNLRFVVAVCRRYQNQGLAMTDLIGEGNLGLILAAQNFETTRTCRFITYAVWWIRQRILQALAEQGWSLTLSPGKAADGQKLAKTQRLLEQKLGRSASPGEIADAASMRESDVVRLQHIRQSPMSLNEPVAEEGFSLEEVLKDDHGESADQASLDGSMSDYLQDMLSGIREREREVLRLYFGLGDVPALTLDEIGERIGLTRERVRQIKDQAIRRLKHPVRRKAFEDLR
jgi:RNA polymerase primary sigma factor